MAELLIFEPSAQRERRLLNQLKAHNADVKVIKNFNLLRTRLDEAKAQLVLIDIDYIPENGKSAFWDKAAQLRPLLNILGVSDQPEEKFWPIILETGILIVPFDKLLKPDFDALIRHAVLRQVQSDPIEESEKITFIGKHPSVKQILEQVDLIANSEVNVLITGDTGSGKTILAKLIHFKSARRNEPFFHINCAAIPEQLLEAELFGYKKGAFTGAIEDTEGKFKAAGRGTILLDEIGEMPVHLQAKLLKVLDEGQYYPIGGTQLENVEARILAATNKNILKEIEQKRFRMDLYYRLNSFEIHLPPLKERVEDIPLLFDFYLDLLAKKNGMAKPEVEASVCEILRSYEWPGNIRELQNVVEILMYRKPKRITPEMLPQKFFTNFTADMVKKGEEFYSLDEIKKSYARYILGRTHGNKSKAAKILGVDIKTFNKLVQGF